MSLDVCSQLFFFQIPILVNDQFSTHLTVIASFIIYPTFTFTYLFNSLYYVHPLSYYMLEIILSNTLCVL